jgi:PKD repeat protein
LGGRLLLSANKDYHRGLVADQHTNHGNRYQKFSWADKFDTGLVTIADIADAALHNKKYDPYWASPLYSSSPATCSATGGPDTGNLQCVDIGDIGTIALYKGVGVTDPISLSSYVGLDPHIDRFDSGVAAPSGSVFLGGAITSSTSAQFSIFTGSTTTVTGVSVVGTTGLTSTTPGTCTVTLTAPDGPGRTTYTCTFGTALAPDINGDTEVEITLTFSFPGVTTQVEIGIPSNSLIVGFTVAPFAPIAGQSVSFTSTVAGSPGYTPVAPLTYSWDFGDGTTGTGASTSHTYGLAGTYTVRLAVTDANSAAGTTEHIITIQSNFLAVSFNFAPPAPVPGQSVSFTSTVAGSPGYTPVAPLTYFWNFGDRKFSNVANPSHAYILPGTYRVSLDVTDANGVFGSTSVNVVVVPFTVDFTCTKSGLTASCTASTQGGNPPFSFSWSFGGAGSGTGLSGPNPTFTYSAAGTYSITLSGTDNTGNTATVMHSITVP